MSNLGLEEQNVQKDYVESSTYIYLTIVNVTS